MRKYLYTFILAAALSSCATVDNKFLKADVIGFSSDAVTSYDIKGRKQSEPMDLLHSSKVIREYLNGEGNIPRDRNTCIYYAMDLALDRISYIRRKVAKNDPNTRYYIFLLTDGLDNNSAQVAKNHIRSMFPVSADKYPSYLQGRIRDVMGGHKNVFEIYPMLLEGEDIKEMRKANSDFDAYLERKLGCLGYSSKEDTISLIHADNYAEILKTLRSQFMMSSYSFLVPKNYVGKQVRMTLVRKKTGEKGTLEGRLVNRAGTYRLEDIKTSGISIVDINRTVRHDRTTCLISETGVNSKESNIRFQIEQVLDGDEAFFVDAAKVKQEVRDEGLWILNTEYSEDTEVLVDTYFILLVDGSTSLDGKNSKGHGYRDEIKMANDIIQLIQPKK